MPAWQVHRAGANTTSQRQRRALGSIFYGESTARGCLAFEYQVDQRDPAAAPPRAETAASPR